MSQQADITSDFYRAIEKGVGSEEDLLKLKLDVFESLEWEDAAFDVADQIVAKGYKLDSYRLRNFGE